ncbi:MAG TPA: molybdopterin-dependent oxidoreductase [Pyrinomonadaceae bacterium]
MADLVKVTINGQQYETEKGARLIDVCREQGHSVPSFCYYADLALQASCRMCLVRIEKMPKLQTSCTITCTDGMIVTTESEEIEKARRGMVEFLLANHPLDCPVCDRGGECELQEMVFDWGGLEERFREKKNAFPEKFLSPIVANDSQRCILCKRCTRVCDEWMGEDAIEAGGRGVNTVIGTYDGWLNCSQCGNCIEVCPTGTLLDATYRHQARPWELAQTITTCTFCSDGCQMSLGARAGEVMRSVARDRYVDGHNGEFLCIKGRFAHPFVNHEDRIKTPLIRYKKGGRLVPATWDEALHYVAEGLIAAKNAYGPAGLGVVGSPRLTNEANYVLLRFAREVLGTENYAATDAFSLAPFFQNLSAPIATHRDIRHAKTIILIGGEPEELQPLAGRQIRQAVRNNSARLVIFNSTAIRLKEQGTEFVHINRGTEDAVVFALADAANEAAAAEKLGVEARQLADVRRLIEGATGDVVVFFGGELSAAAQAVLAATLPTAFGTSDSRRVTFHPLPLYNNSVGVHDIGLMSGRLDASALLAQAGEQVRALYVAGSFLPRHFEGRADALSKLDFLVVQELFETETTKYADVVLPAASFAETDGTFTNSGGLVQRVRQSIPPVHNARPDWMITEAVAREMGTDFGYQMSAGRVFTDIAKNVAAYEGLRYPALKDESKPVQAKYEIKSGADVTGHEQTLRRRVESIVAADDKETRTPPVGHELFRPGTLTGKTPQFHLLDAGNPKPPTVLVSPLYQLTVDPNLRRAEVVGAAGD